MKYYEKDKVKSVPVQDAVGRVLLHDITRIVPDLFKGPRFKKGHIVTPEDVSTLLGMGKEHVYVSGLKNEVHEDEAALRIARAAQGPHINISSPSEGKVGFRAAEKGLLKINVDGLFALNSVRDVVFATLHSGQTVVPGQDLAGTRVVPLTITEQQVADAEAVCRKHGPIIQVKPFKFCNVGLIVTGSEVFHQRIRDGFGPVVAAKFQDIGSEIMEKRLVADDMHMIVAAIRDLIACGANFIAVTGGMSVLRTSCAEIMYLTWIMNAFSIKRRWLFPMPNKGSCIVLKLLSTYMPGSKRLQATLSEKFFDHNIFIDFLNSLASQGSIVRHLQGGARLFFNGSSHEFLGQALCIGNTVKLF